MPHNATPTKTPPVPPVTETPATPPVTETPATPPVTETPATPPVTETPPPKPTAELDSEVEGWLSDLAPEALAAYKAGLAALQAERAEMAASQAALKEQMERLTKSSTSVLDSEAVKEILKTATAAPPPLDSFDPKALETHIEHVAAQKVAAVLAQMRQEQEATQAKRRLEAFIEDHGDLKDPEVYAAVKAELVANEHINLESAYYLAKGKAAAAQTKKDELERQTRQANGLLGASGGAIGDVEIPDSIAKGTIAEMIAWTKTTGQWDGKS